MDTVKAFIFDFDGVLFDSLETLFKVYDEFNKRHGNLMDIHAMPKGDFFEVNWKMNLKEKGLDEKYFPVLLKLYHEIHEELRGDLKPFPGVKEMLHDLKEHGCKMGLVSNNHNSIIIERLKAHGLFAYFDVIVDNTHPVTKPDPGQLIHCMQQMNVKPEETAYIGDMRGDIETGRRAGVKTVAVTYGWHTSEKLQKENPYHVIHKPEELMHAVRNGASKEKVQQEINVE
jgi:phosphoglycolate phosphatase